MFSSKFATLVAMLLALSEVVRGEVYTALVHMEGLLSAEQQLLEALNTYRTQERKRLDEMDKFAESVRSSSNKSGSNPSQYLHNPVNVFQLVNRYYNGWMKLNHKIYSMDNRMHLMNNFTLQMQKYEFPSSKDFKGAAVALMRLQDTYDLTTAAIASGQVGTGGLSLSSHDCYLIGREAYLEENWMHTKKWMLEALDLFDKEKDQGQLDVNVVYDHLRFAEFKLNYVSNTVRYINLLLHNAVPQTDAIKRSGDPEHDRYEQLCQQADPLPSGLHDKLICYYDDQNHNPRLILNPVKVEILHVDPVLYIFRDIFSETEMKLIKDIATPKLSRSGVLNADGSTNDDVPYRISKSAWLDLSDDALGHLARIDQHIEDVTGLEMDSAEELQVVNYGIGGHYEPHYDFADKGNDIFSSVGLGNRIATFLIYMSDVELGGATVFLRLGARVAPSKGDAAFWYNLKRSGEQDMMTLHAACPVLVGSKWVCNKWIHEIGQELRLPCGLTPDE